MAVPRLSVTCVHTENAEQGWPAEGPCRPPERDGGLACSVERQEAGSDQREGSLSAALDTDDQGLGQQASCCTRVYG